MAPVVFATTILTGCLVEIAGEAPVSEDTVRNLTAGDREALLLHVRRITYGDRIELVVDCPMCRQHMDISVMTSQLLVAPYPSAPLFRRRVVKTADRRSVLRFRLPTGADLEASVQSLDEPAGAEFILARCLQHGDRTGPLPALLPSVDRLMAELDPQAELRFNLRCPECEAPFLAVLDMARHLWRQVAIQARALLWEVHTIASAYHWSESEILALSPLRRKRYLDMLDAYGAAG
jgi:hypothetical protein